MPRLEQEIFPFISTLQSSQSLVTKEQFDKLELSFGKICAATMLAASAATKPLTNIRMLKNSFIEPLQYRRYETIGFSLSQSILHLEVGAARKTRALLRPRFRQHLVCDITELTLKESTGQITC